MILIWHQHTDPYETSTHNIYHSLATIACIKYNSCQVVNRYFHHPFYIYQLELYCKEELSLLSPLTYIFTYPLSIYYLLIHL